MSKENRRKFLGALLAVPVAAAASAVEPQKDDKKQAHTAKVIDASTLVDLVAAEWEAIRNAFSEYGWEYYGEFSEDKTISFWAPANGEYKVYGRYHIPNPCISIDDDFFWQHEDKDSDPVGEGTGAQALLTYLKGLK